MMGNRAGFGVICDCSELLRPEELKCAYQRWFASLYAEEQDRKV